MQSEAIKIEKHGTSVWANKGMDELRKTECLCLNCANLGPCGVRVRLYEECVQSNIALCVTRCPNFEKEGLTMPEKHAQIPRYIDAHKLFDNVYEKYGTSLSEDLANILMEQTNNAPTADVAPIRHGYWYWYEEWNPSTTENYAECQRAGWKCSVCETDLAKCIEETTGESVYLDTPDNKPKTKHCLACGALMDKE